MSGWLPYVGLVLWVLVMAAWLLLAPEPLEGATPAQGPAADGLALRDLAAR